MLLFWAALMSVAVPSVNPPVSSVVCFVRALHPSRDLCGCREAIMKARTIGLAIVVTLLAWLSVVAFAQRGRGGEA